MSSKTENEKRNEELLNDHAMVYTCTECGYTVSADGKVMCPKCQCLMTAVAQGVREGAR